MRDPFLWVELMRRRRARGKAFVMVLLAWAVGLALAVGR